MGAAVLAAETLASRGRNLITEPDDITKTVQNAIKNLRGPKDKQLSEALGKIGGEQAKRRLGLETDSRYIDRFHGPDDMTRDKTDQLAEMEYKGTKRNSTAVAKNIHGDKQGSKDKNLLRAKKMTSEKARKIDQPSKRQGGPYRQEEIDLWQEVFDEDGDKRHISVHTNTETGLVRAYERSNEGDIGKLLDEFKMDNFEAIKAKLKELIK